MPRVWPVLLVSPISRARRPLGAALERRVRMSSSLAGPAHRGGSPHRRGAHRAAGHASAWTPAAHRAVARLCGSRRAGRDGPGRRERRRGDGNAFWSSCYAARAAIIGRPCRQPELGVVAARSWSPRSSTSGRGVLPAAHVVPASTRSSPSSGSPWCARRSPSSSSSRSSGRWAGARDGDHVHQPGGRAVLWGVLIWASGSRLGIAVGFALILLGSVLGTAPSLRAAVEEGAESPAPPAP